MVLQVVLVLSYTYLGAAVGNVIADSNLTEIGGAIIGFTGMSSLQYQIWKYDKEQRSAWQKYKHYVKQSQLNRKVQTWTLRLTTFGVFLAAFVGLMQGIFHARSAR